MPSFRDSTQSAGEPNIIHEHSQTSAAPRRMWTKNKPDSAAGKTCGARGLSGAAPSPTSLGDKQRGLVMRILPAVITTAAISAALAAAISIAPTPAAAMGAPPGIQQARAGGGSHSGGGFHGGDFHGGGYRGGAYGHPAVHGYGYDHGHGPGFGLAPGLAYGYGLTPGYGNSCAYGYYTPSCSYPG
jgi:hypothetical protein